MKGCVSDFVLNEVFHKLMVAEVTKNLTMSTREAISYIKVNKEVISEIETIWEEMKLIKHCNT